MAENVNALILPIGADATQLKKSIKEVEDRIQELSSTIKNTPFNLVSEKQKLELNALKETLVELQTDVINTGQAFDKNSASVKKAGRALTSLSLIAQDAPFGFIGIQNNLPALIQSFGELTTTSGGVKGALSQIGSALIGPAGLFLAFSAVTAAVTYAIKEYGSLSNAVDVLFGANSNAIKSQNDFNKALLDAGSSTGAQIAKINILVRTIQNENTSQKDRLAAYRELKRVNPDVVAGIDEQNLSTAKSIKLIGENAKAQLEFIKLQTRATAISKTLDGLEGRRFEANGKYNAARKEQINLEEKLAAIDQKKALGKALTAQERTLDAQRKLVQLDYAQNVKEARDEISQITTEQDNWYKSLEPLIGGISKISSEAETLSNNLKDLRDTQKDSAKATSKEDAEWERMQGLIAKSNQRLAEYYAKQLQIQADKNLQNKLKADADAYKLLEQSVLSANEANAEFGIGLQNQIQGIDTTYANAAIATGQIIQRFRDAQMSGANEFARLQQQASEFDKLKSNIESNLTKPFRDFFDELLTSGKANFDSFVQLAKDALKRIAAQVIAAGLAQLIASILDPTGAAASATVAAGKTGGGGILGILGGLFKSVNNPSFGGVQGGGMQMAGAVNLTLRGSDLVGAINRTNATINRIG
jgi:chromosome segregation ATPase